MSGTEKIHVKQFEGSSGCHDCLRGMFGPRHLSCFTGTAYVIFLELDALDAYDMLLICKGVEVPHASMSKPPMPEPTF